MHRCLLSITQFWLQKWMQSWISPITYIPSLKSKKHIFFSNSWPRLRLQRFSKHLHEFQGDPDLLKGPICFCLKKAMFSPAYTDADLLQTPDTPSQKGFPFFREWLGNACVESWLQSCFCWKGGRWQASPAEGGGGRGKGRGLWNSFWQWGPPTWSSEEWSGRELPRFLLKEADQQRELEFKGQRSDTDLWEVPNLTRNLAFIIFYFKYYLRYWMTCVIDIVRGECLQSCSPTHVSPRTTVWPPACRHPQGSEQDGTCRQESRQRRPGGRKGHLSKGKGSRDWARLAPCLGSWARQPCLCQDECGVGRECIYIINGSQARRGSPNVIIIIIFIKTQYLK